MTQSNVLTFSLFLVMSLFSSLALAIGEAGASVDDNAGKVVKHLGHVEVFGNPNSTSIVIDDKGIGSELLPNSVVTTEKDSRAYIKLIDGSKIILRENSSIRLNGFSEVGVDKGKVLFSVAKRSKDIFRVATRVALLGVRGTSFLVDSSGPQEDLAVHLKEGLVTVSSTGKDFEYFKKKEKAEFENFQKQMNSEFEAYKAKHEKEFREFVKEIDMQANDVLSISNNEARKLEWSKEYDNWFEEFDESFF